MSGISGSQGDYLSIQMTTINDFSNRDKLGRAVSRLGDFADTGLEAIGVCMQNVTSGQSMQVGIFGLLKFRPINVISGGYKMTVTTSGFFQAAAANTYVVGVAYGTSGVDFGNVNSASLGSGFLNFATKEYLSTISGGLLVA